VPDKDKEPARIELGPGKLYIKTEPGGEYYYLGETKSITLWVRLWDRFRNFFRRRRRPINIKITFESRKPPNL
jgi:hypothetical protein